MTRRKVGPNETEIEIIFLLAYEWTPQSAFAYHKMVSTFTISMMTFLEKICHDEIAFGFLSRVATTMY
jgi:hypothetical protein